MFRVFLEGKHRAEARHVSLSPFNALHRWRCSMHKPGLHLTDCQRIPSYFLHFSRIQGTAGREMPCLPARPCRRRRETPPPSPPPPPKTTPNTARLRVRYLTTRAFWVALTERRSADRWLLQLARSGTHVWRSTSNQTDSSVGFDLLQVPPNPIPCQRYHE